MVVLYCPVVNCGVLSLSGLSVYNVCTKPTTLSETQAYRGATRAILCSSTSGPYGCPYCLVWISVQCQDSVYRRSSRCEATLFKKSWFQQPGLDTRQGNESKHHPRTHTHTHTRPFFTALCPGLPGWAGTRRNIHSLTPLLLISHPYHLPPSTTNQPTSGSGAHYFILHTLLHPIIIILSQHMSIPS